MNTFYFFEGNIYETREQAEKAAKAEAKAKKIAADKARRAAAKGE